MKTSTHTKIAAVIIAAFVILALPGYGQAEQTQASADSAVATFTDPRDGKVYRTVKIGGRTWMAENLNFQSANSWCYDNADSNCTKYGRLYTWAAATRACPAGWRLPSNNDWDNLMRAVGGKEGSGSRSSIWEDAGTRLKSTSGWSNNGNGTDDFGFSALPGGRRCPIGESEYYIQSGRWWSATEFGARCVNCAYYRYMSINSTDVWDMNSTKGFAFSVRCIRVRE